MVVSGDIIAANISEYRIYLDADNRNKKFRVANEANMAEKCELDFSYQQYKKGGDAISLVSKEAQAQLSEQALSRLRYSPKNFTLEPKKSQYISFNLRRKVNEQPQEFRTYLNIKCTKVQNITADAGLLSLSPRFVHTIPLIIRTGKLIGAVEIKNLQKEPQKNAVSFELHLQGERSVYGDATIVDIESGKEVKKLKGIAVYPESEYRQLIIPIANTYINNKLRLIFKERKQYGGNVEARLDFSL
jgi:hypothetical protein